MKRRLAAVLAADVAGYTRRMEQDSAGTVAAWQSAREEIIDPIVVKHSGRIVKFTGDGFLAEFPTVQDAVSCAIAMQTELAANVLDFRMGINLGDIIDDGKDIHGEGINVAARIEALCKPGGICVSGSVHEQVRHQLKYRFHDRGNIRVKNVSDPVRVIELLSDGTRRRPPERWLVSRRWIVAGAVVLALAAATGGWWALTGGVREAAHEAPSSATLSRLEAHGRTAVAVLPFVNISGDPSRDYFSDGLTEEVIGALGRFSGLSVPSRNAVMPLKGKAQAPAETARALGVRYLVEGTVRHADERVRVSVQLSDAAAGRLLWSEQYDGEMRDIITVQEKIARQVVGVLAVRLGRAEESRAVTIPTENSEAYDLVMRGRAQHSISTRRANVEARMLFERAIALDPRYSDAYVGLGHSLLRALNLGWVPDPNKALKRMEEAARTAIRLDDRSSRALALLGRVLVLRQDFDQAKEVTSRAIDLNPSDAEAYWGLGTVLLWSSQVKGAIDALETARAYDPYPDAGSVMHLALAYYLTDRFADAIKYVEATVGGDSSNAFILVVLSMAYAELGKLDEAQEAIAEARRLNPVFDPEQFGTILRDPAHRAKIRSGLRKAGWL